MNAQIKQLVIAALMLSVLSWGTSMALAQQDSEVHVDASLSSSEAYVGVPITLSVEIANASSYEPPVIPEIDGVRISSLGTPSQSSQTTIINGHRTDRTSLTYAWRITPLRDGRFVIPSLDVSVNGQKERTRPLAFVVTKSETGDLLFAEVTGAHDSIYVGQALPVTLKIWVKPYRDAERGITLSESDMWQFVSKDPTSLGVFGERLAELMRNNQRPAGQEVLRKDSAGNEHSYYLYELETTFYPKRPGKIDTDDVQVVVSYPTGLGQSRDIFSMFERRLAVTGTRPIVADASVEEITVRSVPEEGRPADYRGAVGRYEIVTQASPTHVKAGDPITLHIGIHGDGPLELVQAPPLAELPELTSDFRVPRESLAGIVEKNVKVFSVSIRPQREGITTIPGIPLTYFDPEQAKFVTVRSEPISIQVEAADNLALTSIVGNARTPGDHANANQVQALNFDNVSDVSLLRSQTSWPTWPLALILVAGPMAFVGTWFANRFSMKSAEWIGQNLSRPASRASRAVADATTPQEVSDALLTFVSQQLNVPAGSLTRSEAIAGLRQRGGVNGLSELNDLLAECEQATYAPVSTSDLSRFQLQGRNCLALLNQRSPAASSKQNFIHPQPHAAS